MFSFLTTFTYTHRMYHNQLTELLSKHNLSSTQWALLRYLSEGGPAKLSEVASYWQVERPTVTPIAQKLYERGIIFVAPGKDKRQKVMQVSESGLELHKEIKTEMDAFQEELLQGVTGEEREVTEQVLEKLLINMMKRKG